MGSNLGAIAATLTDSLELAQPPIGTLNTRPRSHIRARR